MSATINMSKIVIGIAVTMMVTGCATHKKKHAVVMDVDHPKILVMDRQDVPVIDGITIPDGSKPLAAPFKVTLEISPDGEIMGVSDEQGVPIRGIPLEQFFARSETLLPKGVKSIQNFTVILSHNTHCQGLSKAFAFSLPCRH